MLNKSRKDQSIDVYQLLLEASMKKRKDRRAQLLQAIGVEDLFEDGSIKIDMRTCKGAECKLCIDACPTSALYWKSGEIGITEELCIYCSACVVNCIVDDCIRVERKRSNNQIERFSTPKHVLTLSDNINSRKREERAKSIFPDKEAYLKRYGKWPL